MKLKGIVGPLIGILVAVIIAVAVVIPVAIETIGYNVTANGTYAFGVNTSSSDYSYLSTTITIAQLLPLLVAVLVLVGIAGYMTLAK